MFEGALARYNGSVGRRDYPGQGYIRLDAVEWGG